MILEKEFGLLIFCTTFLWCGITAIMSSIPALLEAKYNFNTLQIGLLYIPYAVGGIAVRWTVGKLADRNFRRHGRRMGIKIQRNQQSKSQLQRVPFEKARLELTLPLVYFSCLCVLAYSWIMNYNVHVSSPLILLFFLGDTTIGVSNMCSTLIIDLHTSTPATALASVQVPHGGWGCCCRDAVD